MLIHYWAISQSLKNSLSRVYPFALQHVILKTIQAGLRTRMNKNDEW